MDAHALLEISYRLINTYQLKTKQPQYYGSDELLYSAQVHMIEVIGRHNALTSKEIVAYQGVTKGAVSQIVTKLEQKGFVEKKESPNGNHEILINLTQKGKQVFDYHRQMHKDMIDEVAVLLNQLQPDSKAILNQILLTIQTSLDKL